MTRGPTSLLFLHKTITRIIAINTRSNKRFVIAFGKESESNKIETAKKRTTVVTSAASPVLRLFRIPIAFATNQIATKTRMGKMINTLSTLSILYTSFRLN